MRRHGGSSRLKSAEARGRGYEVVDLQDWFARRHQQDGSVFQFIDDGHWNPTGHEEAARAVMASSVYARFTATSARLAPP